MFRYGRRRPSSFLPVGLRAMMSTVAASSSPAVQPGVKLQSIAEAGSNNPFAALRQEGRGRVTKRLYNSAAGRNAQTTEIFLESSEHVVKRHWARRSDKWCSMCCEPIPSWVGHHGRGDHSLLDSHYNANVEYPYRVWNPVEVFNTVLRPSALGKRSKQRQSGTHTIGKLRKANTPVESPPQKKPATTQAEMMQTFLDHYSSSDKERREEIFLLIGYLRDRDFIIVDRKRYQAINSRIGGSPGSHGALAQHRFLISPMIRLFPDADVGLITNMMSFTQCDYNLETVYDVCGLSAYLEPEGGKGGGASRRAVDSATGQSPQFGEGTGRGGAGGGSSAVASTTVSAKGNFVRMLLGQLRWCVDGASVTSSVGANASPHLVALGKHLAEAILVESVVCRTCEYIVRSEATWREFGCEHRSLDDPKHPANIAAGGILLLSPERSPTSSSIQGKKGKKRSSGLDTNATAVTADGAIEFDPSTPLAGYAPNLQGCCTYEAMTLDGSQHYMIPPPPPPLPSA